MTFYPMYIGGEPVAGQDGERFASYEPATRARLAEFARGGPADVDRAVRAARAAADRGPWATATPAERATILRRIAGRLAADAEPLAELEARDSGGTIRRALLADIPGARAAFEWSAWWAERLPDTEPARPPADGGHLRWDPAGVVAGILPWNFPLMLAAWQVAPAIAGGNACVLKPASFTSATTVELARIAHECGLPPGVVNVVLGPGADVGDRLARHRDVDMVAFSGSDDVGGRVMAAAAATGKRVELGLAGKSPVIICPDADLEMAASGTAWAMYFNNGQVCMAGSRVLVHENVYHQFVELLAKRCAGLRLGDPLHPGTDLGPLISREHARSVRRHVRAATSLGARLVCGGEAPDPAVLGPGLDAAAYVCPAVLADVDPASAVAREEIFGPVLAVIPVRSDDHAVAIANDSPYRLAAAVWSGDQERAHRVAGRLRAERVWINDYRMVDLTMPDSRQTAATFADRLTNAMDRYRVMRRVYAADENQRRDHSRFHILSPSL